VKPEFLSSPLSYTRTQRTLRDVVSEACAVEQFHKAQNRAIEMASGLVVAIGFIAAVGLYFWS